MITKLKTADMFKVEYAAAALAAIEGKPSPKRIVDKDGMAKDLATAAVQLRLCGADFLRCRASR